MKGTYRYQSLSKVSLDGVLVAAGGRSQSAGAVMNILWDIPMPLEIPIQPFVGMGVGVVHTNLNFAGGGNTYMHQGRWDPAYSMMAGFALPLDADHPHPPQLRRVRDHSEKLPEQSGRQRVGGPGLRNGTVSFTFVS